MKKGKQYLYLMTAIMVIIATVLTPLPLGMVKAADNFNNVVIFGEDFNQAETGIEPSMLDYKVEGGEVIIAEVPSAEDKSLFLNDTVDGESVQIAKSFEDITDVVTFEVDYMQPEYTSSAKILRIKGDKTPVIIETKSNYLTYRTGEKIHNLVEVTSGTWYEVKVEVNITTQTSNVYVDGNLILENAPLNEPTTKVNYVESYTPGGGAKGHYLDNFVITTKERVEEPAEPEEPVGEVVVDYNFNEDTIGEKPNDVTVSEAGGKVSVVDIPSSENRSVYLEDTSSETNVAISKSFQEVSGIVTMEMKFMQPEYTSSTKVMRVKGDGTPVIIETKNGAITYRVGSEYTPLIEVTENEWYDIKVVIDLDQSVASVYINDELKLENASFNQAATKVNFIESFTPNGDTIGHYVDDIKVTGMIVEEEPTEPTEPTEPVEDGENGIYEAENALLDSAIIDNKHIGFTGSGFVDYNPNAPGGWIEWTVNVPVEGEYTLDFRYAHGGTDLRPGEVSVNGEMVNPSLAFDPTGGFAEWKNSSMTADLQAGENKIRLTAIAPSGGANIDHVRIYMDYDQIYEAEDAFLEEGKVIIDNKHAGFTGTGFIDYNPNTKGSFVEWTVDVPITGEYSLAFRYAHGGTDERPAEIKVNGTIVEEALAFDSSGGWANWQYTTTKVTLQEGQNIIRATGAGASGGANIDHLRIHNQLNSDDDTVIDVEDKEMEEVAGGLLVSKMKKLGIIADKAIAENDEMTRLAFFSLINDTFGFVYEDSFKNLSTDTKVYEVSMEEWYAYVLKATKTEEYAEHLVVDGKISPEKQITKGEVAKIIKNITSDDVGLSGSEHITYKEAIDLLAEYKAADQSEHAEVVGVHAVSNNVMAVTLNGKFESFDYTDLDVVIPTRSWSLLSPGFANLRIDKAASGMNQFGQTVIVMHSLDAWNDFAEIEQEMEETKFSGDLDNAINEANNLLTWQMDHGGWTKNWPHIYTRPWDGEESRSEWVSDDGVEFGTIDNDATISEISFLAQIYQETNDEKYKESVEKGLDFLFDLQYETGGFAQVYPRRGNYSDYVTFNDEAMLNVLELLDLVAKERYPFNDGMISAAYQVKAEVAIDLAVEYILNAQIEVDGELTAWCAQHDPYTYEARGARSYEHPSISGQESIGIIRYLMSRPQTEAINQAVTAALTWLDAVKLENTRYISGDPNNEYFVEDSNSTAWYRFYEIGTNLPIFSGRDGVIKHNILEIEEERRNGYSWGGHWGTQLLAIAKSTGNYTNKVYVKIAGESSVDEDGRTLQAEKVYKLEGQIKQMEAIDSKIIVAKDGTGDYTTVQAAVDAVPVNNSSQVTIYVKDGVYKEVVTIPNNKPHIHLLGESMEGTILTYDNYAGRDNGVGGTLGTSGSASVYLRADDLRIENMTIENSFDETMETEGKQAVAAYASGDRQYYKNVSFIGNQDTLYTHSGSQYFYKVYIEGDVDFIFGAARVVIEESIIHSYDRGSDSNNGYVTAASTLLSDEYGMLILNSKLTSDAKDKTVYLGRPWPAGGNPNARGSVVYMYSELGPHIKDEGWTSMSGLSPEDARLFEYKNTGPGAVINDSRRQLTDEEAKNWTVENVLKGWDAQSLNEDDEENPGEEPGENPGEGPGENPGEEPGENPGEEPGENPGEGPGENPGEGPGENPGEGPGENSDSRKKIQLDKETEVYPNEIVQIADSKSKVKMSSDLPDGTKLIVTKASVTEGEGLILSGDAYTFEFIFPEGYEDYTGAFELSLAHNGNNNVAIYYYNESTKEWELIGGELDSEVITTVVDHFSTYGVFAKEENNTDGNVSDSESNQTDKDKVLPDTATNISNIIIGGLLLCLIGVGMYLYRRPIRR
ncbi:pectate lyase [Gracilibacillus marinus]|uniref:Pectate lyase n=1 Tax=Gracilibacillus marinus TaxID=630535 RepID=A0ABV8VRU1_9BACI